MKKLVLAILVLIAIPQKSTAQDSKSSYAYEQAYDLIEKDGCKLESLSMDLKKNKDLVKLAVKSCPEALLYADESLRKDREFVYEVVNQFRCGSSFQYADVRFRDDREIVKAAARNWGYHMEKHLKMQMKHIEKIETL